VSRPAPLTFEQQRLWQLDRDAPGGVEYVVTWAWRLHGPLSVDALRAALGRLMRRHQVLRTEFHVVAGQPAQLVLPEVPVPLRVVSANGRRTADWVADELTHPFDLTAAPLWRALLVRSSPVEHTLVFLWQHIIVDAWSSGILVRELSACYRAELTGRPPALPALPVHYGELARAQRERPDDEDVTDQLDYWRDQLAGATPLRLPTDRPRHDGAPSPVGAAVAFTVPEAVTVRLAALAVAERVTMFMVLLAAVDVLLGRHARQHDVSVATPLSDRGDVESEPLIGCFLNVLVLRTDLAGDPSFTALLRRVREVTLAGYEFGALPFQRLVDQVGPELATDPRLLLRVMFVVNNVDPVTWDLPDIDVEEHPLPEGPARHDLTIAFGQVDAELTGHLRYRTELFDRDRIERMCQDLVALLTAVALAPHRRLSDLTTDIADRSA
jgi:hypothetical protein